MKILFYITLALMLSGCEAPLLLDGVEETGQSPIRRTDIFMSASDNGTNSVIVGSEGLVLLTKSGEKKWQRAIIEDKPTFIDVKACPNGVFAALSMEGIVSVSEDNGQSWASYQLDTPEVPQALTCDPNNRIWVVGSFTTIFVSPDNGQSWDNKSFEEDTILSTIQFVSENKGFITGEFGTVLYTTDAGETWEFSEPVPNEFLPLNSVFLNENHGWLVGLNGAIYSTEDGGSSWQTEKSGVNAPLFGIEIVNNHLVAVGDYGTIIQRNINGATDSWHPLEVPFTSRFFFRVVSPVATNKLIVAGGAGSLELVDLMNANLLTDVEIN